MHCRTLFHPCQGYADFFTLEERFGDLRGLKLAYVGDGNNVCHSLLFTGARVGAEVRVATPAGYEPQPRNRRQARATARETQGKIEILPFGCRGSGGGSGGLHRRVDQHGAGAGSGRTRKGICAIPGHAVIASSWRRPRRCFYIACRRIAAAKSPVR